MLIQVGRHWGLGNRMFRYAYARGLQALVPGAEVTGYDLPMFGLHADEAPLEGRVLHIAQGHRHSMQAVASLLNRGVYDHVQLDGFFQRLEFYPDREGFRRLFPPPLSGDLPCLGAAHVVINVRGAEVLGAAHPDYGPVPVCYFERVAERTGLTPVIMGQLGDDFYSDEIRRRFQGCTFLPSPSPAADFQVLSRAVNAIIGVSTFSWLACWMSDVAQVIHMPLKGLFNPLQRPDVDLVPFGDRRYCFHAFPVERWTASEAQRQGLLSSEGDFHCMSDDAVRQMIAYQPG